MLNHLTNSIHLKVFGQPVGEEMQNFTKNIGLMSLGTIGGAFFFFIVNITAGRLLGPTEYGKYSLITSLGQIFIVPMILGISTSSIKYISSSKNKYKKQLIAQNAFFLTIFFTFLSSITFLVFNSQISKLLKINNQIFFFTLIYSIFLSFKYISEAIVKGVHQFKLLSYLEFINLFSIFLFFFAYIFIFKNYNFQSLLIPIIIGLLIYIIIFSNKNHQIVTRLKPNKSIIKTIMSYGKYATLGAISGIAIGNMDKLILNRYMSLADIGTYSIYLSSSSFVGNYLLQIFIQVFFPTVSSIKEKYQVSKKIIKLFIFTTIPIFLINICSTSVILFFMGGKYEINLTYILLFSFLSILTIFSNILWWLINSYGKQGIKFTSTFGILIGAFNILFMMCFIQKLGIIGILFALISTNTIMIVTAILKLRSYKDEN
jgi:O-antigen/teichoic acid export membrane protein